MNPQGGNFGYKLSPTLEAICAVATMATGRPCYLEYSYYQHITYTGKRSPAFTTAKAAADKDGKLIALEFDAIIDHGPYSEFADDLTTKVARYTGGGYFVPTIRGRGSVTFTNHAFGSAFRAFGAPQGEFTTNLLMDELAEKCGMDTWEFMNKNILHPGDTVGTGEVPDVFPLPKLMEMIKPEYDAAVERCKKTVDRREETGRRSLHRHVQRGCRHGRRSWVRHRTESRRLGHDLQHLGGSGPGRRPRHAGHRARGADDLSGLTPEQIHLYMNDTGLCPNSGPAGASRSPVHGGQCHRRLLQPAPRGHGQA